MEAIKVAPVVLALQRDGRFTTQLIVSGIDPASVEDALSGFGLAANFTCAVDTHSGTLAEQANLQIPLLESVLESLRPTVCLIQGDSIDATAAALTAFWRAIPVVHLEAGLRTGDLTSGSIEEGHRKVIDHLSRLHLTPTPGTAMNLVREGRTSDSIVVTGNTIVDAIQDVASRDVPYSNAHLTAIEESGRRIVLMTVHRRESWGQPLLNAIEAMRAVVEAEPDVHVVVPVDPDSKSFQIVRDGFADLNRVLVCEPLSFADQARLLANASLVLTDSGELQEQAPTFDLPVLVLRDLPERPEATAAGVAKLIGVNPNTIVREALDVLAGTANWNTCGYADNPFGDGRAAERTVAAIGWHLGLNERPDAFQPIQANAVLARPLLFRVA